ncbi:DUF4913 domain-containing protein [Paenibacillus sp. TRM 82003]|uniref:DUF4913 domain-containing protein n=1 Tax=Kineococcus sp. TRM81007 TaxID=2925831 RepID=UPI001F59AFC1|nr:DUF4913 domain-containing protein [Kineococcus sp. TRM81007]MCI2238114.1 DUF4913 domain-containing protein [Kineococcus sp. TRM81007]MCI3920498.1 DUF4913 domain-containing protein [Paenibacillus sp. TRM 82003]
MSGALADGEPDWAAEETAARIARLELRVDELDALFPEPGGQPARTGVPVAYDSLDAWVEDYFATTFTRPLGGEWRWCARWREHPEAVVRLNALWHAFEALRRDPDTGMAIWLRDHLDHQLTVLLGSRGPFAQCSITRHEGLRPLPIDAI